MMEAVTKRTQEELIAIIREGRKKTLEVQLAEVLCRRAPKRKVEFKDFPDLPDELRPSEFSFDVVADPPFDQPLLIPKGLTFSPEREPAAGTKNKNALPVQNVQRVAFSTKHITHDMQMKILHSIHVSGPDHVRLICSHPQRSPEWFSARQHRITGSKAGAAANMNEYESQDQLLRELLWPTFVGNRACTNGVLMEPFAAKSLLRLERRKDSGVQLAIPGLIVSVEEPIIAYSADGVLIYSDGTRKLVEIKTPVRRKPYSTVPLMYTCQIQLGMYILNLQSCLFVVYCGAGTPGVDDNTHVTEIPRDNNFIKNLLLPRLREFYFKRYLPLRVCFDLGGLRKGQVHMPHGCSVEYLDPNRYNMLQALPAQLC